MQGDAARGEGTTMKVEAGEGPTHNPTSVTTTRERVIIGGGTRTRTKKNRHSPTQRPTRKERMNKRSIWFNNVWKKTPQKTKIPKKERRKGKKDDGSDGVESDFVAARRTVGKWKI